MLMPVGKRIVAAVGIAATVAVTVGIWLGREIDRAITTIGHTR